MKLRTLCAMDLHHTHTAFEAQTRRGEVICRKDLSTERRHLIEMVGSVPGPAGVAIEEGPMTDWALRTIQPYVAEVLVCDPRRNRLISEDGDKTDGIDPGKLIELYRNQSLRPVHHPTHQSIMDLRAWVWAYQDQVKLVTAAKNKLKAAFRAAGLQYSEGNIYSVREREGWLGKLPRASVRERVAELYGNLDDLTARWARIRERMHRIAHRHPVAKRFLAIPGYGPVRALMFLVVVDTPFRFASPQKLWRYAGLGLKRRQSGDPRKVRMCTDQQYNRPLHAVAWGSAERALRLGDGNPFEVLYRRQAARGLRESLARLEVARRMLLVPWGMWKAGTDYNPALVS
jgi:transposase